MMLLAGKTALITGSAAGIGQEVARLFGEHGARLVLLDRDAEGNRGTAATIGQGGVRVMDACVDLRDRRAIDEAVSAAVQAFGTIDILINNAGVYPRQPFLSMTEQQWDEMQAINLKSMFHTTQAVLPMMLSRGAGKIVNISSVTFHLGMAGLTHYVASKGGVLGFTRALAREVGDGNVHVNAITPGAVLVEAEKAVVTEEQIRLWMGEQSLKRRILPIDIARVCLFLSCELSDGMTGQALNVDGGWVMH